MTLKFIRLTAAAVLLISMLPVSVYAEETEEIEYTPETVTVSAEDYSETNDELLEAYLEQNIFEENVSDEVEYTEETYDAMAGTALTNMDRRIYFACLPKIKAVSCGEQTSTVFEFTPEELGLEFSEWTAEELGVETVLMDGNIVPSDAYNALLEKEGAKMNDLKVLHALLDNHAYEMYWFEKTIGINISRFGVRAVYHDGVPSIYLSGNYTIRFTVADDYKKDTYETDPAVINTIQSIPDKVKEVVDRHAGEDDLTKLDSYRQEIIDMTDYNEDALNNPQKGIINPWQLIWVFDGDPNTKVVCEGYSKAFQYLCELSEFQNGVNSTIASGPLTFDGKSGPHMWNIVTMEDGEHYIADITNCDEGMAGMYDRLFMVGGEKLEDGSYRVTYPEKQIGNLIYYGGTIIYTYNEGTLNAYEGMNVLNIADHNYVKSQNVTEGKCGDDLSWKLDEKGVLTITGTGKMYDFSEENPSPWNKDSVRKVIVNAGAENIGQYAFTGCSNLTEIQIPSTVKTVGYSATYGCDSLSSLVYDGNIYTLNKLWVENNNEPFMKTKPYVTLLAPVADSLEIIQGDNAEIPTKETLQLNAKLTPEDTDSRVRWYTSDKKVASVSESGLITANVYGKATITAVSVDNPLLKKSFTVQTRFHDVNDNTQSYYKPVYWGADNGVVAGYDSGVYFGPDNACTRAQFVTFLWRLAGRQTGKKDVNFPDVDPNASYYRAVKWAVSEGIIVGYKHDNAPATFEPEGTVTRGQVATMLWRFAKRQTPKLPSTSPFSDIDASNSSYRAVVWGQQAGVIRGYKDGTFQPDASCLRQHIVTFLYRYARDVMHRDVN